VTSGAGERTSVSQWSSAALNASNLRVLVVHSRYRSDVPSGENEVVEDELRLLRDHGCVAELVELRSDDIPSWPLSKKIALPARVVWSSEGRRVLEQSVVRFRPDVIHIHNTFPLFSPGVFWRARAAAVGVVHTLHNFRPLCPASTLFRDGRPCEECLGRLPWPAVRFSCYRGSRLATIPVATMVGLHGRLRTWQTCVDRLIAVSAYQREKYIEAGWPGEKIRVKHNTVLQPPAPTGRPGSAFLCMSRLSAEKGVDVLLEGWRRAFSDGTPSIRLAGSGDQASRLRAEYGGLPGVVFLGQLDRVALFEELSRARAVVVPSRWYEGSPRAVVEAYAAGVPLVASRVGSLTELVEDGVTGLLAAPGDPDELAGALRRLADSDELAARLGEGARARYERSYSPDVTVRELLAIYREAIAARTAV